LLPALRPIAIEQGLALVKQQQQQQQQHEHCKHKAKQHLMADTKHMNKTSTLVWGKVFCDCNASFYVMS